MGQSKRCSLKSSLSGIMVMATPVHRARSQVRGKGLRPTLIPQSPQSIWLHSSISTDRALLPLGTTQDGSVRNSYHRAASCCFTSLLLGETQEGSLKFRAHAALCQPHAPLGFRGRHRAWLRTLCGSMHRTQPHTAPEHTVISWRTTPAPFLCAPDQTLPGVSNGVWGGSSLPSRLSSCHKPKWGQTPLHPG